MKKVSIMLPTYNAAEFISECLDSILDQDYENLEVVVSDDCSTDNTVALVQAYQKLHPTKIKLLANPVNLGITKNCNQALSNCTGEYICFFAGDDVMLRGKISTQVQLLEQDADAAFCYHPVEVFNSATGEALQLTEQRRTIFSFLDIISKGGLPGANSVMAKRVHIPPAGYNELIPAVSDWLFFIELGLRGRILFADQVFAKYRKHVNGVSAKADKLIAETLFTVDFIEQRFAFHPAVSKASKRAKFRYLAGSVARMLRVDSVDDLKVLEQQYLRQNSVLLSVIVRLYIVSGISKLKMGSCFFSLAKNIVSRKGR